MDTKTRNIISTVLNSETSLLSNEDRKSLEALLELPENHSIDVLGPQIIALVLRAILIHFTRDT